MTTAATTPATICKPQPITEAATTSPYVDKHDALRIICEEFRQTTARALERWPIPYRIIDGRRIYAVTDIRAHIAAKIANARPGWGTGKK